MRTFCPFFSLAQLDQHLPGGQTNQRDGSRFLHAEVLGLQRHVGFVHGDEFRERPDPAIARPSIDLVTRFELPDFRSDPGHGSGHVVPEDEGRAIRPGSLNSPSRSEKSRTLSPAAWISTRTSSCPSVGSGMSPKRRALFFLYRSTMKAFMTSFLRSFTIPRQGWRSVAASSARVEPGPLAGGEMARPLPSARGSPFILPGTARRASKTFRDTGTARHAQRPGKRSTGRSGCSEPGARN